MAVRTIPPDRWGAELDSFSRQHEGWLVSVHVRLPDGRIDTEAHDLPLRGVSPAAPDRRDLVVSVGNAESHLEHQVVRPTAVGIEKTPEGIDRALVIDAPDGTTRVEFRSPMRPEEVDGLPVNR